MTDHNSNTTDRGTTQTHPPKDSESAGPAPTLSGEPDRELELKLK